MRILIADKFEDFGVQLLERRNHTVNVDAELTPETLPGAVKDFDPDVLVVRSTKVPAAVFDEAASLSLVVRAGAGYDNIDVAAASANAISVANCPGKNAIAVAELAMGLILAADRSIADQTRDLREGKWAKKAYAKTARGIHGATLGIIGVGHISKQLISRAKAFGMPVVAWSRSLSDEQAHELGVQRVNYPVDVARAAHVVSVHVAHTPETEHLIDAGFIAAMNDGATLVNTARGKVVDIAAVIDAVKAGRIRYAADVYTDQPKPEEPSTGEAIQNLAKLPGFVGTHHCGASTQQAQDAIAAETVRVIREYEETGTIPNVVNRLAKSPATRLLRVRHLNKAGVLAHVIGRISEARINIEEMENVIFKDGTAACAKILLDDEPSAETLAAIQAGDNVLSADLTAVE